MHMQAQRGDRGIAATSQPGARRGWMVSIMLRLLFPQERSSTHCISIKLVQQHKNWKGEQYHNQYFADIHGIQNGATGILMAVASQICP